MTVLPEVPQQLREALNVLPDADGGRMIVLATGGTPPAMAMLSTGDVWLGDGIVRIAVHATSSVGARPGNGCTLLISGSSVAYRVELEPVRTRLAGALLVVEGQLRDIRPTAEPPWQMEMRFHHDGAGDPLPFVRFWSDVRSWLAAGAVGDGPAPPPMS